MQSGWSNEESLILIQKLTMQTADYGDRDAYPRPVKKCISEWLLPKIELPPSQETLTLQMDTILDY
jgi:hypothetical protein